MTMPLPDPWRLPEQSLLPHRHGRTSIEGANRFPRPGISRDCGNYITFATHAPTSLCTRAVGDGDPPTKARLDTLKGGGNRPGFVFSRTQVL